MRIEDIQAAVADLLLPPPDITVSEWADRNRRLVSESSSERGRWRTDRAPYQRAIMDTLSPKHPCQQVILMSGAQLGKSECLLNFIGYVIGHDPGPILCVQFREVDAEAFSKDRLAPMLRSTPSLMGKVSESRSRDSNSTILHKKFIGGSLTLAASNSPGGLAMRSIRYCLLDEVDRYPSSAGSEGDPVNLAITRTVNFWNRKVFLCSTPTVKGKSRIEKAYLESNQQSYWVPCPHCGEFQVLLMKGLTWEKGAEDKVEYRCEHCAALIPERHKTGMLRSGEWRAANPECEIVGFWINSLYSPWLKWREIVKKFLRDKEAKDTLREFSNTVLAECWEEQGDAPDWQRLYDRREDYKKGIVPANGLFLTAGVDIQADRIEAAVYAWGRDYESWLVDYLVFDGNPYGPEPWNRLSNLLHTTYRREGGADLGIMQMAVDTGFATQEVYAWCRRQAPGIVLAVDGRAGRANPLWSAPTLVDVNQKGKRIRRGLKLWPVGTWKAKSELYGWLEADRPTDESGEPFPKGFVHLPKWMGEEFCKQLTAERLVTRIVKGYQRSEWEKTRDRNEALDTRVYARAAAAQFGIDRFNERHWKMLETQTPRVPSKPAEKPTPKTPPPPSSFVPPGRGGWFDGRGDNWFGGG